VSAAARKEQRESQQGDERGEVRTGGELAAIFLMKGLVSRGGDD
jgi:hypothetical protein